MDFKTLNSLKKPYKYLLKKVDERSFNGDKKVTTVLAGSPRSGTTWFLDILTRYKKFCSVYEPLHYRWFPEAYHHGFKFRRRLRKGAVYRKEENYMAKVMNGEVHSREPRIFLRSNYSNLFSEVARRIRSKKIVAKFVRAGRMLGWMADRFNEVSFIFIVRHPCAVIKSQMENKISGHLESLSNPYEQLIMSGEISDTIIQKEIYEIDKKYKTRCKKILSKDNSLIAKLSIVWALDNLFSYRDMGKLDQINNIVKYEDFLQREQTAKLEKLEELGFPPSDLNAERMRQFEIMTEKEGIEERLFSWKSYFDQDQVKRIMDIICFIEDSLLSDLGYATRRR